jgi:hypothetical protein
MMETSYGPGVRPTCEKLPFELESVSDADPVAVLVILTLARAIADPEESDTVPLIIEVVATCP